MGGRYSLNVNNSADDTPRNVSIINEQTSGNITGLAPGLIDYHVIALDTVTISAGPGGNTITYDDPNTIPPNLNASVVINSGAGRDTVNVLRTFSNVTIRGNNAADTVNVGAAGSVQGIRGPVFVSNAGSRSTLNVDDSGDAAGRTVTLSAANGIEFVAGLAPAEIRYFASDVSAVSISAGPGGNTFTVNDTPDNLVHPVTTLNTGTGVDTVNVRGTTGPLAVNGQNGRDTVNVGAGGSVQNIKGTLNIRNSASFSAINMDNSLDPVGRGVLLAANNTSGEGSVLGLAPADILYRTFDVSTLTINGGTGADTFNVNSTAANVSGPAATVLNAGGGADAINVRSTSGPISVNAGPGNDAVTVGSLANTLDPIKAVVTVNGQADSDVLTVNDQGSPVSHAYGQATATIARSGAAAINYFSIEHLVLNKGPVSATGTAPQLVDLALPATIDRVEGATLTGRLTDPDAADTLSVAVDWGDGSAPSALQPGRSAFAVKHWYRRPGQFTVRVFWTDGAGHTDYRELQLTVTLYPAKNAIQRAAEFRAGAVARLP